MLPSVCPVFGKYKRHGHVFQGRFINKVIVVDEYNLVVSAYIHNNAKDLPDFRDCVHTYYSSSYGVYIGNYKDDYRILNTDFILSQFGNNSESARVQYAQFVTICNNVTQKDKQFELIDSYIYNEPYEYRSERFIYYRDLTPEKVIELVAEAFDIQTPDFIKIMASHILGQSLSI